MSEERGESLTRLSVQTELLKDILEDTKELKIRMGEMIDERR